MKELILPTIKEITDVKYFTKGKRGVLFTAKYKNKKVVIKTKLPSSLAQNRIENEGFYLKELNKHNIGPKLIKATKEYFFYYFVKGDFILEFLKKEKITKQKKLKVLIKILNQCFVLDKLLIDKEEMHRPLKHILIHKNEVVMLDFERSNKTIKPKNVTQFCVFLIKCKELLQKNSINIDKERMIALAKLYKRYQTKENLKKIIREIKS
jgi:putative serine/threonine protein kinase